MKEKGITLVALIITIIILIILAGISLNLTLGENGLFQMALKAKENMELAQVEEQEKLNALYTQLAIEGGSIEGAESGGTSYDAIQKLIEFKQEIANAIEKAGGNAIEEPTTAEKEEYEEAITGIVAKVTSDADATEEDITAGKTAWVNGKKITGNKTDHSGVDTENPYTFTVYKMGSTDGSNMCAITSITLPTHGATSFILGTLACYRHELNYFTLSITGTKAETTDSLYSIGKTSADTFNVSEKGKEINISNYDSITLSLRSDLLNSDYILSNCYFSY